MKFIATLLCILALIVAPVSASTPTVTLTTDQNTAAFYVIKGTFSTAIANADSAYIYYTGTTPFDLANAVNARGDSLITIELGSAETSADSTRLTCVVQVSNAATPAATDWSTALTNATSFTNLVPTALIRFNYKALAGPIRNMRVLLFENDTNKDATQAITVRVTVPKP